MLQTLQAQPDDGLLGLISMFNGDQRKTKLDLGVGMYRDEHGETPVFQAVKSAERILLQTQRSKGYLGPCGDDRFVALLYALVFGETGSAAASLLDAGRLVGVQTPGGGGGLRLGAELIAAARPGARVWLGRPTWPNHQPVLASGGLQVAGFRYSDAGAQSLCFEQMLEDLRAARPGDVVLLQACCHNPTGTDLDEPQWRRLTDFLLQRALIPFLDFAYQGLGLGLDADAYGVRHVFSRVPEALLAYSCDKNFGLYRERTGALIVLADQPATAWIARSNMEALARVNWSMPPDHGAAVVRTVLDTPSLYQDWRAELAGMRQRVTEVRQALAAADERLDFLSRQFGMFSQLQIAPETVALLRRDFGIYMPASGRMNLAGLRLTDIPAFVDGLARAGILPVKASKGRVADAPV